MENRISLIQKHINKYGYKNYLEIGVQAGHCFAAVQCEKKTGVDPDPTSAATVHKTSDEFFAKNKEKFDIIFIDGLHHADQVEKDILNSLACLAEGGTILMHDCKPTTEFMQRIPLTTQVEWTGDCWKAFVKLRTERDDLEMKVIDCDWGVGVIRPGKQEKLKVTVPLSWENFLMNQNVWLNLVAPQNFQP